MNDEQGLREGERKGRTEKVLESVGGTLLGLMVVIVFVNVVSRYYLNYSLAFTEELSRFMFTWVVMIGSVLALIHNEHLGVDVLFSAVPPHARKILMVINDLVVFVSVYILFIGGYRMTRGNFNWPAPATNIPYGAVEIIVPVAAAFMLIIMGRRLVVDIMTLHKGKRG